jgi:phytoene synthase
MLSVSDSFGHCKRIARARARNFFYSFLLLPKEEKEAMCAVYAFMRRADDLSDNKGLAPADRRAGLQRWNHSLEQALQGRYGDDPILPAFHHTVERYAIPPRYFYELMKGVASDLDTTRYQTFDDLYRYCYRVASVVGMTTVHIFGYESDEALELAEKCGVAFQLTNILRDIREDAEVGRIYLPEEELARFDLEPQDLLEGCRGEHFREFMEFQCHRANEYYRQAAPILQMVKPHCRAALWAMVSIYHRLLQRIQAADYNVFDRRARLSDLEKMSIVVRACKLRYLGGAPPFPA